MITKLQHKQICQKIRLLQWEGFTVETYGGISVTKVSVELGEIYLSDRTKLTWRSYQPYTKIRAAWEKFFIPRITLYQHSKIVKERK